MTANCRKVRLSASSVQVADNPVFVHFAKFGSSVGGIVSELATNRPEPLFGLFGKIKSIPITVERK